MSARGEAPAPAVDPIDLLAPGEDVFVWVSREGQGIFARSPRTHEILADRRSAGPGRPAVSRRERSIRLGCSAFEDSFDGDEFLRYELVAYHDVRLLPSSHSPAGVVRGELAADDARAAWRSLVERALATIDSGEASKIVCARRVRLHADDAIHAQSLARAMLRAEGTYRYLVRDGDAIFAGASPERLVEKRGDVVRTEAVAGTAPAEHDDVPLDQRDKDRREHRAVVTAIEASLAPLTTALEHPDEPIARRTGRVQHLVTPFEGRIAPGTSLMDLAGALHPTPAVAGTPRDAALRFIEANEAPRGWYAGPIGWHDHNGDGELAVALRCVRIEGTAVDVFAGAGIVSGSDPDAEFDETVLKMRSTLASLGLELSA